MNEGSLDEFEITVDIASSWIGEYWMLIPTKYQSIDHRWTRPFLIDYTPEDYLEYRFENYMLFQSWSASESPLQSSCGHRGVVGAKRQHRRQHRITNSEQDPAVFK